MGPGRSLAMNKLLNKGSDSSNVRHYRSCSGRSGPRERQWNKCMNSDAGDRSTSECLLTQF